MKSLVLYMLLAPALANPVTRQNYGTGRQWTFAEIPHSHKDLVWYPCFEKFECARLSVPLDYNHLDSLNNASVPLIKAPAQQNSPDGPYNGMILINPGGPGGSGMSHIIEGYEVFWHVVGTNYDFVSWDPRGINNSWPLANCSSVPDLDPFDFSSAQNISKRDRSLEVPRIDDLFLTNSFHQAQQFSSECSKLIGGPDDAGSHMSSAVNARDMIRIVDSFAETEDGRRAAMNSSLLNFWGFSYGSYLGSTFASMFRDRVGRVVLDGNVAPSEYKSAIPFSHADDIMSAFFMYCHLAGEECHFNTGSTAEDIHKRFHSLISQLDAPKARQEKWSNQTEISKSLYLAKGLIGKAFYTPVDSFPKLAETLLVAESLLSQGNFTFEVFENAIDKLELITEKENIPQGWRLGVLCSDTHNDLANTTLADFQSNLQHGYQVSNIIGEFNTFGNKMRCANWTAHCNDVFTAPFGGETANPILIASNTLDPVTGIDGGRVLAREFTNSSLLVVEGLGHTTMSIRNKCSREVIKAYFQNGTIPNRKICALEAGPWNITLTPDQIDYVPSLRGTL